MPFAKLIGAATVAAVIGFAAGPAAAAVGPEAGSPAEAAAPQAAKAPTAEIRLAGGGYYHRHRPHRGRAYRKGYRQGYRAARRDHYGHRPHRGKAYRKGFRQGYRQGRHYEPRAYYRGRFDPYYGPRGVFVYDGPRVDFGVRF